MMHLFARPIHNAQISVSTRQFDGWGVGLVLVILTVWSAGFVVGFIPALTLLTVIGFVAAIIGIRHPPLGLWGMGMLCTLDPATKILLLNTGGILRWHTLNYFLLIVMLFHVRFLLRLSDVQTRLFQLFLLLVTLEIIVSPGPMLGLDVVLGVVTMFGLLIYFVRVGADRQTWYWLGIVNGTLAAGGGLLFYLQQNRLPPVDPNDWYFFSLTALFAICLALPFARVWYNQLMLAGLALINFGWIFLSGSRGGTLQALVCMCMLVLLLRGLFNRVAMLLIAVIIGLVLSTLFTDLQARSLERIDLLLNSHTSLRLRTSGRSELVLGGWYLFLHNPLGVGTGGFGPTWAGLGNVEGLLGYAGNSQKAAHAGWIKILVENGVPGFLLLAGYVLSFAVIGWRKRDYHHIILGLFVTAALAAAFTSVEPQWGKAVWFLVAGVTALFHDQQMMTHLHESFQRKPITNIVRPGGNEHQRVG